MPHEEAEATEAGWTRGRVARELDVSITTVRRFEADGRLRPRHGGEGTIRYFAPEDVLALKDRTRTADNDEPAEAPQRPAPSSPPSSPATRSAEPEDLDGETAAEIFALFASGWSPAQVVVELELPPRVVAAAIAWRQRLDSAGTGQPLLAEQVATLRARVDGLEWLVSELREIAPASPAIVAFGPCAGCGCASGATWIANTTCCAVPVVVGSATQLDA